MDTLLELKNIHASYEAEEVLDGVCFKLEKRHTLGLAGESGSGKSTAARVAAGLLLPTQGEVLLEGEVLKGRRTREQCRRIQMVFQNPDSSLNPRYKIGRILSDAMLFHKTAEKGTVREQMMEWIRRLELPEDTLERYPKSFSGGQKQRIALARALCVKPDLLIADEPTSALDVSIQLKTLQLIKKLQQELGLTILFISHDMGALHALCDEIAVMRDGEILETGPAEAFFRCPKTEYGKLLLDSVPGIAAGDAYGNA